MFLNIYIAFSLLALVLFLMQTYLIKKDLKRKFKKQVYYLKSNAEKDMKNHL